MTLINSRINRRAAIAAGATALASAPLLKAQENTPAATPSDNMIEFAFRDIVNLVPEDPQQVVVLEGRADLEFAVLVGYPIIASGNFFFPDEPPGSRLDGLAPVGIEVLEQAGGHWYDAEQLVNLEPDLIVTRATQYRQTEQNELDILAAIAPLLAPEVNSVEWREDLVEQATILNRSDHLQTHLDAYDNRVAEAREEIGDRMDGKKVYFLTATTDATRIAIWNNNTPCSVAVELGFNVPLWGEEEIVTWISQEQFGILSDADLIIRQVTYGPEPEAMTEMPLWESLPAVQAGHVHDISSQFNGGLAIQNRLLIDELLAAVELLES